MSMKGKREEGLGKRQRRHTYSIMKRKRGD